MKIRAELVIILLLLLTGLAQAQNTLDYNPIHPVFPLLDSEGEDVRTSGKPLSTDTTCGNCHNTEFINNHNTHYTEMGQATCIQCHFSKGKLEYKETDFDEQGNLLRSAIKIHPPKAENCALCHGVIHSGEKPLILPEDFEKRTASGEKHFRYDRTAFTGEIISDQKRSDSYLNLANKDSLTNPWDVHAGRMVTCNDCHFTSNNPEKIQTKSGTLPFLKKDPRKLSMAEYLYQPDHNLKTASCIDCHDPLASHDDLPYAERHMARVDCLSCHAPLMMGPAINSLDETVSTINGTSLVDYRNIESQDSTVLATAYIKGYQPALIMSQTENGEKLAPYNLVTHYYWANGEGGSAVDFKTVQKAFLSAESYHSEILSFFDADKDGKISNTELQLDTEAKVNLIKTRLADLGVVNPTLVAEVTPHKIKHGTMTDQWISFDCAACHSTDSRIAENISLASYTISGLTPKLKNNDDYFITGSIETNVNNGLQYKADSKQSKAYILGHDSAPWSDSLGFVLFLLTAIGISVHGGLRILSRNKRNGKHDAKVKRVYMYSLYERIWHWLMAGSILLLVLTGIEIHWVGSLPFFGFVNAIWLHNILALVMIVNAFLSFFYHLVSNNIRQFIPPRETFLKEVLAQAKYYLNGIFLGAPHPMAKTPDRKLNPLQQITYMMLLNVLLPFQVVTGVLIWIAGWYPETLETIGGLMLITPLHNLGAWLLASFIVAHVYLTTTGHTVLTNIKAMATGYEDIELNTNSKLSD